MELPKKRPPEACSSSPWCISLAHRVWGDSTQPQERERVLGGLCCVLGTRGGIGDVPRGSACPAGRGCHLLIDVPAANAVPRISRGCHGSRKEKRGEKNKKAGKKKLKKASNGHGRSDPQHNKKPSRSQAGHGAAPLSATSWGNGVAAAAAGAPESMVSKFFAENQRQKHLAFKRPLLNREIKKKRGGGKRCLGRTPQKNQLGGA